MRYNFTSAREAADFMHEIGIIDEHLGVLRQPTAVNIPAQAPPIKICTAAMNDSSGGSDGGGGIGFNSLDAFMAAVVESLERQLPSYATQHHLLRASYRQLGQQATDPFQFIPYADDQYVDGFPCWKYHHDLELNWTQAWNVGEQRLTRIPAQIGGTAYDFARHGEPFLIEQTSTGTAGHMDARRAIISSVQELVERHATMDAWYAKGPTYLVDPDDLFNSDPNWSRLGRFLHDQAFTVRLLYFPNIFNIPVTWCVLTGEKSVFFKPFAVGASARPSLWESAKKSLFETMQNLVYFSRATGAFPPIVRGPLPRPSAVLTPPQHLAFYALSGDLRPISWLWTSAKGTLKLKPHMPDIDVSGEVLAHFLAQVRATKREWLLLDFTPNGYRQRGFRFVRSLLSHFVPMNGAHVLPGKRFVSRLGHAPSFYAATPHPFP
jgi:thiazole/oxazole-forming peptide maturase SagD family component